MLEYYRSIVTFQHVLLTFRIGSKPKTTIPPTYAQIESGSSKDFILKHKKINYINLSKLIVNLRKQ